MLDQVRVTGGYVMPDALSFVIPDLIRDPLRTIDICRGERCTLDPGSSPGMTKAGRGWADISMSSGLINGGAKGSVRPSLQSLVKPSLQGPVRPSVRGEVEPSPQNKVEPSLQGEVEPSLQLQ